MKNFIRDFVSSYIKKQLLGGVLKKGCSFLQVVVDILNRFPCF